MFLICILFRISGGEPIRALNSMAVRSVAIENYSRPEMTADRGEIADTEAFAASQQAPESVEKPLHLTTSIIFAAAEPPLYPSIIMEAAHASTLGMLDQVWAKPDTQITADSSDTAAFRATIKFDGDERRRLEPGTAYEHEG